MHKQVLNDEKLQTQIVEAADNVYEVINKYANLIRENRKAVSRILQNIAHRGIEDDTPEAHFWYTVINIYENASDLLHKIEFSDNN